MGAVFRSHYGFVPMCFREPLNTSTALPSVPLYNFLSTMQTSTAMLAAEGRFSVMLCTSLLL